MAFADKYNLSWKSKKGVSGVIRLQKDGYVGSVTNLILVEDGLEIDYKFTDWFEPIIGQSCSISILNDAVNFYEYEDLLTLDEREFKIIIDASDANNNSIRLFDGWINSDNVELKYLKNSTFRITGSNYLSKLDNSHPTIINTQQRTSIINIVAECLSQTGKDSSIYVLNRLEPSIGSFQGTNQTLFNRCAIETELFWNNNIEKKSSLAIIKDILKPVDSYTYWWDNNWYIQRYADSYNDVSTNYVGYNSDPSVGWSDVGNIINISSNILDINSLELANRSQSIAMTPGLKTLDIKLDQSEYFNLTINDFSNATPTTLAPSNTLPNIRRWTYYENPNHIFPGYNGSTQFSASCGFGNDYIGGWLYGTQLPIGVAYKTISNAIFRYGAPTVNGSLDKDYGTLSTSFYMTIENESTNLKISWKFAPHQFAIGIPTNLDYRLRYTLRATTGAKPWIHYNDASSYWYADSISSTVNYVFVNGSDLDVNTFVKEVAITVPIGNISSFTNTGDQRFVFNILGEDIKFYNKDDYYPYTDIAKSVMYGDVNISASSSKQNNIIRGEISNNTMNKKEVEISIFDITSLNYRNGIFSGSGVDTRTQLWTDKNRSTYLPLTKWLIADKFSLYNKNRRSISSDVIHGGFLKPFSMWKDNNDSSIRNYLLTSYTYKPTLDKYSCKWNEWSNDTINIP